MNIKFAVLLFMVFTGPAFGQTVRFSYHGQRHDMRAVPYIPYTEGWTDHVFGVSTYQLTYHHRIFDHFNVGLGVGYELSKTTTGLNPDLLNLRYLDLIDRYRKFLIYLPVEYKYPLGKGFSLGLEVLAGFGFNRSFMFTRNLHRPNPVYKLDNFSFNDCEFISFVEYRINRISLRAGYRLFHVKRVDDAIFFEEYFDKVRTLKETDVYRKDVDMYNPFKLVCSIGFSFKDDSK